MKTDKEAAHEYAAKCKDNPVQWDALLRGFLAGCKHKEESRWIPVDKEPSFFDDCKYWVLNSQGDIDEGYWNVEGNVFQDQCGAEFIGVTHYQPIIIPPPPQTNK